MDWWLLVQYQSGITHAYNYHSESAICHDMALGSGPSSDNKIIGTWVNVSGNYRLDYIICIPVPEGEPVPTQSLISNEQLAEMTANLDAALQTKANLENFLRKGDVNCDGVVSSADGGYVGTRFQHPEIDPPPLSEKCK